MDLYNIKEKLEQEGYNCLISNSRLIAGKLEIFDDSTGWGSIKNAIGVELKDNIIVVDYTPAQIHKEETFMTINEAIAFIR